MIGLAARQVYVTRKADGLLFILLNVVRMPMEHSRTKVLAELQASTEEIGEAAVSACKFLIRQSIVNWQHVSRALTVVRNAGNTSGLNKLAEELRNVKGDNTTERMAAMEVFV